VGGSQARFIHAAFSIGKPFLGQIKPPGEALQHSLPYIVKAEAGTV